MPTASRSAKIISKLSAKIHAQDAAKRAAIAATEAFNEYKAGILDQIRDSLAFESDAPKVKDLGAYQRALDALNELAEIEAKTAIRRKPKGTRPNTSGRPAAATPPNQGPQPGQDPEPAPTPQASPDHDMWADSPASAAPAAGKPFKSLRSHEGE